MNRTNEERSMLSVRDLATIGIFTAVMFALTMITGVVTGFVPVAYLLSPALFGVLAGPPFMLVVAKVRKPGCVFVPSVLIGLIWTFMGGWPVLVSMGVLGLVGETIAVKTRYQSFAALVIVYILFVGGYYLGAIGPMYYLTDWYLSFSEGQAGYDPSFVQSVVDTAFGWASAVAIPATVAGAIVGSFFGKGLVRKHFKKAGIV